MAFDLRAILLFSGAALLYSIFLAPKARGWALLVGSVIAVYGLQAPLPIRFSDFILPTATLILTAAVWWFTRASGQLFSRDDAITLAVMAAGILALSFMRFVDPAYRLTPSRPPEPLAVLAGVLSAGGLIGVITAAQRSIPWLQKYSLTIALLILVALFVLLKTPTLAAEISRSWRGLTGQDVTLASITDLNWLGFSYVAFRWIHTLRDRQSGLLPSLSLREYLTYVIFFPAFTAGPIDRAERFAEDWKTLAEKRGLDADRLSEGVIRIVSGLLKKFVIADLLAQGASLNVLNAAQATSTPGLWLLLYGYALRLFFDFSGYSDIAIGLGLLFGVRLPENFNAPYLKTNITAFWQSWHMTLSSWARFYVFSPLTRWLLRREVKPSPALIVLTTQVATMVVIGLWHGVTLNFLIWGLWQGVGLFIHKQWSDRTRAWYRRLSQHPRRQYLWRAAAWFITFHYIVIGWVWFALPDPGQSLRVLAHLFGRS